jgi:hypothetical protein
MSLPEATPDSSACAIVFTVEGGSAALDVVLFTVAPYQAALGSADIGTPDVDVVLAYAKAAVAKMRGQPVSLVTTAA